MTVSEMNKDEAMRCLDISKAKYSQGNTDGAIKFAKKSIHLYASQDAKSWLEFIQTHQTNKNPEKQQKAHNLRSRKVEKEPEPISRPYTQEQLEGIQRIKKSKTKGDLYAILGLNKSCSMVDIKKSYRKLALLYHPDKCGAPGADEAFKAIGHAFTVLNDAEKKSAYDRFGIDPDSTTQTTRSHRKASPFHGFETGASFGPEVSPEELFNMFFGESAASGVHSQFHTTGNGFHSNARQTRSRARQTRQEFTSVHRSPSYLQLLPLLGLFIFSLVSFLAGGFDAPDFSLTRSRSHFTEKLTPDHKVRYYVDQRQFDTKYKINYSKLKNLERQVERQYHNNLQYKCSQEREIRNYRMAAARGWLSTDQKSYREASLMRLPSCEALQNW